MSANKNKFQFISNENIARYISWRDFLRYNNDGKYIFASNLVDFLNYSISSKNIWLTEDVNTTVGKDNCKQSFDSSDEVERNNKIDYKNAKSHE